MFSHKFLFSFQVTAPLPVSSLLFIFPPPPQVPWASRHPVLYLSASLCPRHSQMLQVKTRQKQILSIIRKKATVKSWQALKPASKLSQNPPKAEKLHTGFIGTVSQQDFYVWFVKQPHRVTPDSELQHYTGRPTAPQTHWFHRVAPINGLHLASGSLSQN